MKIYVTGPYSASISQDSLRNLYVAIDAAQDLWHRGHLPYIPHLTHWVDTRALARGEVADYDEWLDWGRAWLLECDGVLVTGNYTSKVVRQELEWAADNNIPIYWNINEIPTDPPMRSA